MKTIIIGLLCLLAFSSYKALTTESTIKQPVAERPNIITQTTPKPEPSITTPETKPDESIIKLNKAFDELVKANEKLQKEMAKSQPEPEEYEITIEEGGDEPEEDFVPEAQGDAECIESKIAEVFGNESRIALAIAKAESGLNPSAVNTNRDGSKDIGIFQINDRHGWSDEERFDWLTNIKIAKDLRDTRGWSEWAAYNDGSYKRFL